MKHALLMSLLIPLLPLFLQAEVVDSWDGPNEIWGITWDGTHLWAGQDDDPSGTAQIMKLDPESGAVLQQFPLPGEELRGLAWDGESLWVYSWRFGSTNVDTIFQVDPTNGAILSVLPTPFTTNNYVGGMTWMDGSLWLTRYYPDNPTTLYQIDPLTGEITHTIPSPHAQPEGITHDGSALWMVGDYFGGADARIYQLDPVSGDTLFADTPLGDGDITIRSYDMTYDGTYHWLVTRHISNVFGRVVFKLEITGAAAPEIAITDVPVEFEELPVGESASAFATIQNVGTANLTFSATTEQPFAVDAENIILEPDSSYALEIQFTPSADEPFIGTVTILSNDPENPVVTFLVTGEGLPTRMAVTFSPEILQLRYGGHDVIGLTADPIDIQNSGDVEIIPAILEFVIEGSDIDPTWYTVDLAESLAPDESVTLHFVFGEAIIEWVDGIGGNFTGHIQFSLDVMGYVQVTLPLAGTFTGDVTEAADLPERFGLAEPWPNPFNAGVKIRYTLPKTSEVNLQVLDLLGRQVRLLQTGTRPAGQHEVEWNGSTDSHLPAASGVYFIRLQAGEQKQVRRMQLVK